MEFKVTGTTKHTPIVRIGKNIRGEFARLNALDKFAFRYRMVNVHRIASLTALCFFAASLAFASPELDHRFAPLAVYGSPVTVSMMDIRLLPSGVPTNKFGYANGRAFHHVINANDLITTAGADMFALVVIKPLDSFGTQSLASEIVALQIPRYASGFAMVYPSNYDWFATSTSAQLSRMTGNPSGDRFVKWFSHLSLLKSTNLASGELLEPLTGCAEGNQQRSQEYTLGTFRDYLSRTVGLITGTSARVSLLYTRHDIVRTFEKSRELFVNDTQDPKIGLTDQLSPLHGWVN